MSRYFFHLNENGRLLEDFEGLECASQEEALAVATKNARDVMVGDLREGRLCLDCFIAVADSSNRELARLSFREAVSITG
jgi:hypothetical protein